MIYITLTFVVLTITIVI